MDRARGKCAELTSLSFAGNIFIQTNLGTEVFDYKNNIEVSCARSRSQRSES
jgi:hypothetical protein